MSNGYQQPLFESPEEKKMSVMELVKLSMEMYFRDNPEKKIRPESPQKPEPEWAGYSFGLDR